jgi:toxin CcdB
MQFDVYRNNGAGSRIAPYLIELQHDHVGNVRTAIVAPLVREGTFAPQGRLTPAILVLGENHLLSIGELFTIERKRLGPVVTNVDSLHQRIIGAIDLLFTGI